MFQLFALRNGLCTDLVLQEGLPYEGTCLIKSLDSASASTHVSSGREEANRSAPHTLPQCAGAIIFPQICRKLLANMLKSLA